MASDSRDRTPSGSEWTIAFPANEVTLVEGQPGAGFVDRTVGLHSKRPRMNERSESWLDLMTGRAGQSPTKKQKNERSPLLETSSRVAVPLSLGDEPGAQAGAGGGGDDGDGDKRSGDDSEEQDWQEIKDKPWYRRPSPAWILPGTMLMAMSMGMILSPRVEIYYELVCRSIDSNKSGVVIPAPPDRTIGDTVMAFASGGHNDWATQCRKSPAVQQAVATLNTMLALLMGCLAALTSGYWGSLGDRHGRKPIIALAMFGMLVMDVVFLVTVNYHQVVTYYFLLVGPLVDGCLGGYTTAMGAANAYLSDATRAGSRARVFSVMSGLAFLGIALGPTLGSLIVRATGRVLSPFYVALTLHSFQLLAVIFVVPESLSKKKQLANRRRHLDAKKAEAELDSSTAAAARTRGLAPLLVYRLKTTLTRPFRFLRPLRLLLPRRTEDLVEDRSVLERKQKRSQGIDFELFKLSIAYAAYVMVMAMMSVKILYTSYKYDWGPQENGYLLSYVGVCRMAVLIVVLPLFVKYGRKPAPVPDIPPSHPSYEREARYLRVVHDSHFDLFLARISVAIEVVGAIMMALNAGRVPVFLAATFIAALGSGTSAAIQSLALALAPPRDSGKLFASLSVVQSLASQVVGPLLFGIVFIKSVSIDFPEAIFWVGVALFSLSAVGLSSVRLHVRVSNDDVGQATSTPAPGSRERQD